MKTDQSICLSIAIATLAITLAVAQVDYYPPMDTSSEPVNHKEVKCLGMCRIIRCVHLQNKRIQYKIFIISCAVCKATIDEMLEEIGKVDPKKTIDIGGYRLEANGKRVQRTLPLTKSETYLTELMETICEYCANNV